MTQKVLYLTPGCFDKGGISRYSRYQISALREILGERNVRVYSLLGPDADGFEVPFDTRWHGRSSQSGTLDRARFAARLLREAALWRPDVIHSAHVNFSPLVNVLRAVSGGRSVLNVYGLELWSGLSTHRANAMGKMGTVIADCHATARHVSEAGLHAEPAQIVWDCVDLDRFQPGDHDLTLVQKYGLPDPKVHPTVLSLGRLAKGAAHKGYDRLIQAFASVVAQCPEARLVIAGKGDDRTRLEQLAATLGIADRVTFTGAIDEADLASIYRTARVFSLVSDKGPGRGEGIPLTPLEALASGVAIVVGDEDGSGEAIDKDRNGYVVSPRQESALVHALLTLLGEAPDASLQRSREARAVAEERFGYRAFVSKHRAIYAGIAGA